MWRSNQQVERVCGRVFLFVFLLALPIVWARVLSFGQNTRPLEIEYRDTELLPQFTAKSFLDGDFQDDLEAALSDQRPFSESIRLNYMTAKKKVFDELSWISIRPGSGYRLIGSNAYTYDGHDYIVTRNDKTLNHNLDLYKKAIQNDADYYSCLPIKNKFQYIVTTDPIIDFDHPSESEKYFEKIDTFFPAIKTAHLRIPDFETYMRYYLKNDHHWNNVGRYQGYKDIISLMLGNEEPLMVPVETMKFKSNTVGSRSRMAYPTVFNDPFEAYRFDFKEHDVYLGNTLAEYGNQSYYNTEEMRNAEGDISYNLYYGFDVELIIYDFKQPEKDNLAIIGYSDTNAVNELVASHFNKTWVFDPRFSSRKLFESIIAENDIQYLLLMPNASSLIPTLLEAPGGYN